MFKGNEFFYISGYWKDDKEEFSDYLVSSFHNFDEYDEDEDDIFYFGLSETEIIDAIEKVENTVHEFVITSYEIAED